MGPSLELFSYLIINLFVSTGQLSVSSASGNFATPKGSCSTLNFCHFTKPPSVKEHKNIFWRIQLCNESNQDIYEQGLNMAHQSTTFRFSHFPVSVLSFLHNKHRVKREKRQSCLFPACCHLHFDSSYEIDFFLCTASGSLCASCQRKSCWGAQCPSLQAHESQHCLSLLPTSWIPLISDPKYYYRLTSQGDCYLLYLFY